MSTSTGTAWSIALAALVGLAVGCRSADTKLLKMSQANPNPRPTMTGGVDTGVVKTDFKAEIKPEQQVLVHLDLARAYETQGSIDAAIAEYQKAVQAATVSKRRSRPPAEVQAMAHRRMAGAMDRIGRFKLAETHYKAALALNSSDARVWNDSGYSAYLQGRYPEAERRLRMATKQAPEDPRAHTNLGLCLAATGRTDEALAELTKAAGPAVAHANLGYLLAATGRTDEARVHYQKALALQPALDAARHALAQLDRTGGPTRSPAATAVALAPSTDRALSRTTVTRPAALPPAAAPIAPTPIGVVRLQPAPPERVRR